ncbi:hypothetical protein Q5P01_000006 [Channa striata]|uniref:Uncharacterized protein n=1 Tax=Channa striata TaxID=64152 RepID=A0AA88IHV6_CHASR|nr:hypothetical protein Q5P01_000006 [Channa striata]
MSESTSITSAVLNRPRENGDPTPNRDASEIDEELDSDDEVLYVDTNENKKLEMKFNPLRGIHTEIHCMGLGPRDDNDLEDGMKGWRGKCYGLAFRPDYYKECTRGRRRKRHGGRGRETKLNTKCDRRQIGERDNAEQDAESYSPSTPWVDEDQSDREARSGRLGERREISTNRTPSLTSLGEEDTDIEIHWVHILHSWKKFLEWLGDRWWGDAPFDKITRALNQPTAQNAMIFSEPREPSRLGALCSITWKGEKNKLRSHAIVLNRGMYTCTDLRGYFDSPTNIAVDLSRLRGLEILSKPRHLMSHKKSYFYDSRIPTQLRNIKDALKGAWWGTYSRRQSLATMESVLRNLTPFHARVGPYGVQLFDLSCGAETRAGIVTASTDTTETRGPGYLFEVLTSPDTLGDVVKYKVVFSARGFMVLTEDGKEQLTTPHADIRGVIHHLTKNQKIVLLSRE